MKYHLTLRIQSEFVDGSEFAESIQKEVILYLIKDILIKSIPAEEETSRAEFRKRVFQRNVEYTNWESREKIKQT